MCFLSFSRPVQFSWLCGKNREAKVTFLDKHKSCIEAVSLLSPSPPLLSPSPPLSPPLLSVSSLSLSLSLSSLFSRLSPLPSPLSFLFRLVSPFPISFFLIFANPFLSLLLFHNSNDGQALQQFVKILRTETNLAAGTYFYKLELYRTTKLISFALATALYSLCI